MRNAIRTRLISQIASLGGRVYQPHMANASTPKPYAVGKLGVEASGAISVAFDQDIQVWVYVDPNDFGDLDTLKEKVISVLHKKDLTTSGGKVVELHYTGTIGDEYYDPEWKALTIGLTFETIGIREGR